MVVVAGRQQAVAALCLHHVARLDVCNRAPSSCLCHVAVRDRFAGLSSSVLCWFGFERSDTVRKLLEMILCVLVTPSNTSLVPTAITGPRAPTQGARSAAHFLHFGVGLIGTTQIVSLSAGGNCLNRLLI